MTDKTLPTIDDLKAQAKRLRTGLSGNGNSVTHGQALELVARQYGYRDWNTIAATAGIRQPAIPLTVGARVGGRYLGQPFTARVVGVKAYSNSGKYHFTLDFETPVDVVTFKSFSAFRRRVTCTVDTTGRSAEKTSNGQPVMEMAALPN
jgi:hypothetical protein